MCLSVLFLCLICGTIFCAENSLDRVRRDPAFCKQCFADPKTDSVLRRAAFRQLLTDSSQEDQILTKAVKDPDPKIRQYAIYHSFLRKKADSYADLKAAAQDPSPEVAQTVFICAKKFPNRAKSIELLTFLSKKSPDKEVRREANRIVDFPFYRENRRLRDNPTYDHDIVTVKSIQLPTTGLKFRQDPAADGHKKGYFNVKFNEKRWKTHKIGSWESQGLEGYDGIAWYRIHFTMPAKIDSNAVELHFGAVDEVAWVWLNGVYIGQHDVGSVGWDIPFDLDVTKEIRWGGENVLVVRVEDTIAAGGIWKPITVNILK